MPNKLPSDEDLGAMPAMNWQRGLAVVDNSPLSKGADALGRGFQSLASGVSALGVKVNADAEKQKTQDDALGEAKALSAYTTGRVQLDAQRDDLTDPDELAKHKELYQQNLDAATALIPDPKKQELFKLKYAPDAVRGGLSVDSKIDTIAGDQQMADLHGAIDTAVGNAPKLDPDTRVKTIDDLNTQINQAETDGRITHDKAQAMRTDTQTKYATAILNALPAEQRVAALSAPDLSGDDTARTAQLLRGREGFKSTAYWDVNHYRVGYGSDTITLPDGTVKEVQQGDAVTKEDAERDLARRTSIFLNGVRSDIGDDAWNKLPPNARAALGSVAYNYGSLPGWVVEAAKSGDAGQVGDAIERLQGDNNGVNRSRRILEASIARGGAIPGGNMVKFLPETSRIDLLNQAERESTNNARQVDFGQRQEKSTVQDLIKNDELAIASPYGGTPIPELTPERVGKALGPDAQVEFLRNRELAQKYHDETHDWDTLTEADINARVEKLRPTEADGPSFEKADGYFKAAQKARDKTVKLRADDPAGVVDHMPTVQAAAKTVDPKNPASFAPVVAARMTAQDTIGIAPKARSPITAAEVDNYTTQMLPLTKGQANVFAQNKLIDDVIGDVKARYGEFAPQAMTQILSKISLSPEASYSVAAAVQKMAPLAADAVGSGEAPPPPAGVKPQAWTQVLATRPLDATGKPIPAQEWANAIAKLTANPTDLTVRLFNNSKFGRAGFDGAKILKQLAAE